MTTILYLFFSGFSGHAEITASAKGGIISIQPRLHGIVSIAATLTGTVDIDP